jgi:diguanylate cyclase (GGDEF)-like protein
MLAKIPVAPERRRVLRILLVDSSIDDIRHLRGLLQETGEFITYVARTSVEARELLADGMFDVALIEYSIWSEPDGDLVRVVREEHGDVAVVLLTSGENERDALPALKLGAHDFLSKHNLNDSEHLAARVLAAVGESRALRRRDTMVRWLEREARTDHLTGLYNRRAFDERLQEVCAAARTSGQPVTLIVIDIAGTRSVNDAHGHEAGDDMIRRTAMGISRCLRGADFAARVGGDDFGIILPNSDIELGRLIARRITHEVERLNGSEWGTRIPVTLSFGVATGRNCQPGELFTAADHQLSDHKSVRPPLTMLRNTDDSDGPHVA